MLVSVLLAAAPALAADEDPGPIPLTKGSGPFQTRVLQAIYAVFPLDPKRFYVTKEETPQLILYDGTSGYGTVACRREVAFVVADAGFIAVGFCDESAARLKEVSSVAPVRLREFPNLPPALAYQVTRASDGSEIHYFPVIVVGGHGGGLAHTVVLFSGNRTILVQSGFSGDRGEGCYDTSPARCPVTRAGLTALIDRLRSVTP